MPDRSRKVAVFPLALIALGVLLILGVGGWYLVQALQPTQTVQSTLVEEGDSLEIPRVSLSDAQAAFEAKGAVFVDVRDATSYAQAHIPGALSIPLGELPSRLDELNPSDWIITYCT